MGLDLLVQVAVVAVAVAAVALCKLCVGSSMQRSLAVSSNRHVGVLYIHSAAIIHRNSAIIQSAISLSQ